MDIIDKKMLLVFDGDKFINIISIGDIQRAILKKYPLDTQVLGVLRQNTKFAVADESMNAIKGKMQEYRIECMPVLDNAGNLTDVIFWEDLFPLANLNSKDQFNIPVVIMAGGKGTRLQPLTNVLPKPLIPIGEKSILENIMDSFVAHGSNRFFISVNYKAEMIKYYFNELQNPDYQISYFTEDKPLGTAGSMFLLKGQINETFFVSNCDILIKNDYSGILDYHKKHKNEITIVSAFRHYPIPYGIIETSNNGRLKSITEKPELSFQINTGMYILEPELLDEIPENSFFHITDLIEKIKKRKGKIGVFPITEKSWIDIGGWDEYIKNNLQQ
ncbi:MAG: nucleotidyltransferase family protein [Saprospiraceae bacterium]|nr:nucleotidyltransferase family protein [Saprospiraceae bacterium]